MTKHNEPDMKNNHKKHKHKKYNIKCFEEKQIINEEKKDNKSINDIKENNIKLDCNECGCMIL